MADRISLQYVLRQAREELSDVDKIATIVYWATQVQGEKEIPTTDVKKLARDSRTGINSKSVSGFLSHLKSKGVVGRGDSGYYLTVDGEDQVESLIDLSRTGPTSREGDFISVADPDNDFYAPLINDINRCYRAKVNDAVLILTRKLIENLLIDILRGHYGKQRIDSFYIPSRGRFRSFSTLLENFNNYKLDFKMYYLEVDELVQAIDEFRQRANASAHSIEVRVPDKKLKGMSSRATELIKKLLRMKNQVAAAS